MYTNEVHDKSITLHVKIWSPEGHKTPCCWTVKINIWDLHWDKLVSLIQNLSFTCQRMLVSCYLNENSDIVCACFCLFKFAAQLTLWSQVSILCTVCTRCWSIYTQPHEIWGSHSGDMICTSCWSMNTQPHEIRGSHGGDPSASSLLHVTLFHFHWSCLANTSHRL
jgi:hypothetical protein